MFHNEKKNEVIGALIGLARSTDGNPIVSQETYNLMIEILAENGKRELVDEELDQQLMAIRNEKNRIVPGCGKCASPCGRKSDFDISKLEEETKEIRSLKGLILYLLQKLSIDLENNKIEKNANTNILFARSLFAIGENFEESDLLVILQDIGEIIGS